LDLPLEIQYRGVDRTDALDRLIQRQAARLERFHPHITSCRVAVSQPHRKHTNASRFRVRLRCMVPPGRELVAAVGPSDGDPLQPLSAMVREAFFTMERKLKVLSERNSGAEKQRAAAKRAPTKGAAPRKKKVAVRRRATAG
jgi:hypothetical protein